MLIVAHCVLLLVSVKTVVRFCILRYFSVGGPTGQVWIPCVFDALVDVEEVDDFVLQNLAFLVLPQVWRKHAYSILSRHGELKGVWPATRSMALLVRCQLR